MANEKEKRDDILARINDRYAKMSKGHKAIANFIMEDYDQAAFMTASVLGQHLGISESTVVRFAAGLGYDGYPEMQEELAAWVQGKLSGMNRVNAIYRGRSRNEVLDSVLGSDMENIRRTMEELDPAAFDAAVEHILAARHVYVVGVRSAEPLADLLTYYLNMVRDDVRQVKTTSISEQFEQMFRISEEDVLIGISFPRYSMRTLKALEFANDRNAQVITITDSLHSPMCLYSSCNLCAASEKISMVESLTAAMSLINALAAAICLRVPETVRNSMESLEEAWENYQVYMNDEIDYIDGAQVVELPEEPMTAEEDL